MDEFDVLLSAEDSFMQQGLREGEEMGRKLGLSEGFDMGRQQGHELGKELGYYVGCCLVWKSVHVAQPRAIQSIEKLLQKATQFNFDDPASEEFDRQLSTIRSLFKKINSLLKSPVHLDSAVADLSF